MAPPIRLMGQVGNCKNPVADLHSCKFICSNDMRTCNGKGAAAQCDRTATLACSHYVLLCVHTMWDFSRTVPLVVSVALPGLCFAGETPCAPARWHRLSYLLGLEPGGSSAGGHYAACLC